jgi:pimeloyl-ACP methyl ester carboxylesterase
VLALTLRFAIALQLTCGAALGYWLAAGHLGAGGALVMGGLAATALPVLTSLLALVYTSMVSRADEPAKLWWRALAGETWVGLQVFLLRQPWSFVAPQIQPATGPQTRLGVLLVHGYVCNHRLWDRLTPVLRAQGHSVLRIDLEPPFASIDDYASQIEAAVQALRQHTQHEQVALLGHSMGGLALRAWMRRFGTAQAARVITLGTPHAGTQINGLLATPNALQMAWQSTWLQELAASETDATRKLFRIALSAQDNIVFPQRAQTLAGVTPQVFEGLGHLQLCFDARVTQWVCQQLALL